MKDHIVTSRNFSVGVCEEYGVRRILFDISGYREAFGPGTPVLLVTRPGESQSYPISPEVDGGYAVWVPQQRDTDIPGTATVVLQWYVDGGLAISTEYYGRILGSKSATGEVPDAEERWYRDVLQAGADALGGAKRAEQAAERAEKAAGAAEEASNAAEDAAKRAKDAAEQEADSARRAEAAANTAVEALSKVPCIGENGNWYIGAVDSGVSASGPKGDTGDIGPQGPKGDTGDSGTDGLDGKSAYQYAVDGGYPGTEAEFTAKLSREYDPDAKTDAMTQAVGLDADGKLWTEPSSVPLIYDQTLLAEGVVLSGTGQWTLSDTGLTMSDIREWKIIGFSFQTSVSNTVGLVLGGKKTLYRASSQAKGLIEFLDSKKTLVQVRNIYESAAFFSNSEGFVSNEKCENVGTNLAWLQETGTTETVQVYTHNELTADVSWKIWGVLKG